MEKNNLTHIIDVTYDGNNIIIRGFNQLGKYGVMHNKENGLILHESFDGFKSDSGYADLKRLFGDNCVAKDKKA